MKNKKGFTLVELLAVIVILGILTAIAIPSVLTISKRIKNNVSYSKGKTIEVAAEMYAQDNKKGCNETIKISDLISGGYLKSDVIDDDDKIDLNTSVDGIQTDKNSTISMSKICGAVSKTSTPTPGNVTEIVQNVRNDATSSLSTKDPNGEIPSAENTAFSTIMYLPGYGNSSNNYGEYEIYLNNSDKIRKIEVLDGPFYTSDDDTKLYANMIDEGKSNIVISYKDGTSKSIVLYNYIQSVYLENGSCIDSSSGDEWYCDVKVVSENIDFSVNYDGSSGDYRYVSLTSDKQWNSYNNRYYPGDNEIAYRSYGSAATSRSDNFSFTYPTGKGSRLEQTIYITGPSKPACVDLRVSIDLEDTYCF